MKAAATTDVMVNAYELFVDKAVPCVYKYELKFIGVSDDREKELSQGLKNE